MNKTIERRLKRIYNEFDAIGRVGKHAFAIKSESQGFFIIGNYKDDRDLMKILSDLRKRWRAHYALVIEPGSEP